MIDVVKARRYGSVSGGKIVGQHDLSYRQFFTHRRMIQDLLREIVGEGWGERIDFASGERVSASFVSAKHENRGERRHLEVPAPVSVSAGR
jgi:hypothetical protein